jgi:hypothetical protein
MRLKSPSFVGSLLLALLVLAMALVFALRAATGYDQILSVLNTFGSWFAGIGALVAVVVALRLAGRQEELAYRPQLKFHFNDNPDDPIYEFIGFQIENVGSGNAYLMPAYICTPDEEFGTTRQGGSPGLDRLMKPLAVGARMFQYGEMTILTPGEKRHFFWIGPTSFERTGVSSYQEILLRINFALPYASMDGKVWILPIGASDEMVNMDRAGREMLRAKYDVPKYVDMSRFD